MKMRSRLDAPNSGSPVSPSYRHVSGRDSTALTAGGIRTGPQTKAFGGDGFEAFYSTELIFQGVSHELALAHRDEIALTPALPADWAREFSMQRFSVLLSPASGMGHAKGLSSAFNFQGDAKVFVGRARRTRFQCPIRRDAIQNLKKNFSRVTKIITNAGRTN